MIKTLPFATFLLLACMSFQTATAQQDDLNQFNISKDQTGKRSMYALGGWAVGNFAVSGALLGSTSGADRHFHEMNIYWNTVNLGLSAVGLLSGRKKQSERSLSETIKAQHSTEKIYLLNAGLDVGYIMGGLYLTELANRFPDRSDQFTGWGYSIAFQGSFLLVLDTVMYIIYNGRRKKKLDPIIENLEIGASGFRLRF